MWEMQRAMRQLLTDCDIEVQTFFGLQNMIKYGRNVISDFRYIRATSIIISMSDNLGSDVRYKTLRVYPEHLHCESVPQKNNIYL